MPLTWAGIEPATTSTEGQRYTDYATEADRNRFSDIHLKRNQYSFELNGHFSNINELNYTYKQCCSWAGRSLVMTR
ncbi:hypothetical protein ANN_00552 [Periplaneta americana]|uniref:Uncharacterized protein n=1 Tax=Periplaneta americana TaxID=6978 RepID=A0ABQ8TR35_PERAM|nr:hypothetical protein ANN_00552 [Periplaneta americana]